MYKTPNIRTKWVPLYVHNDENKISVRIRRQTRANSRNKYHIYKRSFLNQIIFFSKTEIIF